MDIKEILKKTSDRFDADKKRGNEQQDLIGEDRLHTPPTGDKVANNWEIDHGGMAG